MKNLALALIPYTHHLSRCCVSRVRYERANGYFHNPIGPCDCGLAELLAKIEADEAAKAAKA